MNDPLCKVAGIAVSLKESRVEVGCFTSDGNCLIPTQSFFSKGDLFMAPYIAFSTSDGSIVAVGNDAKHDLGAYSVNIMSSKYWTQSESTEFSKIDMNTVVQAVEIHGEEGKNIEYADYAEVAVEIPISSSSSSVKIEEVNESQEVNYDVNTNSFTITVRGAEGTSEKKVVYEKSFLLCQLIKKLKQDAEAYLGHVIQGVVVSTSASLRYLDKVTQQKAFLEGGFQIVRFYLGSGLCGVHTLLTKNGVSTDDEIHGVILSTSGENIEYSLMTIESGIIEMQKTKILPRQGEDSLINKMKDYCLQQWQEMGLISSSSSSSPSSSGGLESDEITKSEFPAYSREMLNPQDDHTLLGKGDVDKVEWRNFAYLDKIAARRLRLKIEQVIKVFLDPSPSSSHIESMEVFLPSFIQGKDLKVTFKKALFHQLCLEMVQTWLGGLEDFLNSCSLFINRANNVQVWLNSSAVDYPAFKAIIDQQQFPVTTSFIPTPKASLMEISGAIAYSNLLFGDFTDSTNPDFVDLLLLECHPYSYYLQIQNEILFELIPEHRTTPNMNYFYCKTDEVNATRTCEIYEGIPQEGSKTLIARVKLNIDSTEPIVRLDLDHHFLELKTFLKEEMKTDRVEYILDSSFLPSSPSAISRRFPHDKLVEFDSRDQRNHDLYAPSSNKKYVRNRFQKFILNENSPQQENNEPQSLTFAQSIWGL